MHEDFTHSGIPGRLQETAVAQGGFLLACVTDAATTVVASETRLPESAVGVSETKITFLAPGRIGQLECKVTLQQLGGRIGFVDVVGTQGGKVLLTSSVTLELTRKPFTNVPAFLPSLQLGIPSPPAAEMSSESRRLLEMNPWKQNPDAPLINKLWTFFGADCWFFDVEGGRAWTNYSPAASLADAHGNIQEGFLAALMDNAMAFLLRASRKWEGGPAPTVELQARFFRPVCHGKTIEAFSRILHVSPRIAHVETEFFQDGERCATATSSLLTTYKPTPKL